MNRNLYLLLLVLLGAIPSYPSLGVPKQNPQAEKAVAAIRMPASFQADFVYTRTQAESEKNDDDEEQYQIEGKIWVKGNKYRLVWEDQVIVSDGKTTWNYAPSLHEVQIYNEQEAADKDSAYFSPLQLLHLHEDGFLPIACQQVTVNKKQCNQVELVAQKKEQEIRQLVLVIDRTSHQIKSIRILEEDTTVHNFILMKMTIQDTLEDGYFQFQMPTEPVEVIDFR